MRLAGWACLGLACAASTTNPAAAQLTIRASVSSRGTEALGPSWDPTISDDGLRVAFTSVGLWLVDDDTNGVADVFVRDFETETTVRASAGPLGEANAASEQPVISGDGRFVAFTSAATNLDPAGRDGIFLRDLDSGPPQLVVSSTRSTSPHSPALSFDGRRLAYLRYVVLPTSRVYEIHVLDLDTLADATLGNAADINVSPAISGDGRFVAWETGPAAGLTRLALHDSVTGDTRFADSAPDGSPPNGSSNGPSLSRDGSKLAFSSLASNLVTGDTNGTWDVFVRDVAAGGIARASVDSGGGQAEGPSRGAMISPDGHFVAFRSRASTLDSNDVNGLNDAFVHNLRNGATHGVSVSSAGAFGHGAAGAGRIAISSIGPRIAFTDDAPDLVPDDDNVAADVFVHSLRGLRLVQIGPAIGSELGGDLVHLSGSDFVTPQGTEVRIGDAPAVVLGLEPNRIRVLSPPGSGLVDVTVSNGLGTSVRRGAYRYVAPELAARYGNVGQGRADREDVMLLNAVSGEPLTRETTVPVRQRTQLAVFAPPSLPSARFVLYAWRSAPNAATRYRLPGRLGSLVFAPPTVPGARTPLAVWNNLGFGNRLGLPTLASRPAPSLVFSQREGAPVPLTITFQGLIEDGDSIVPQGVSVTNAIVVHFVP